MSAKGITGWQLSDTGGQPRDTPWAAKRVTVKSSSCWRAAYVPQNVR